MPKSNDKSAVKDGRRNNATPAHSRFVSGGVANPWGAAGKPKVDPPTQLDRYFLEEAARIVSRDEGGPVNAGKRLVQEEYHDALIRRDPKVRAGLIDKLNASEERAQRWTNQHQAFFLEAKIRYSLEFDCARILGKTPPDLGLHPDHVEVSDQGVRFTGPTDRRGREAWEHLKAMIRIAASIHEIVRAEWHRTGDPEVLAELKAIEKHRRMLMRRVPKSWDWREEIYCRDSQLEFAKNTVRQLKEIGYVASDDRD